MTVSCNHLLRERVSGWMPRADMVMTEGQGGEPAEPSGRHGVLPMAPNVVAFSRLPKFICFFHLSLDVELDNMGPVKYESCHSVTEELSKAVTQQPYPQPTGSPLSLS